MMPADLLDGFARSRDRRQCATLPQRRNIDERAAATGIAPSTDVLEHITMMFYNLGKQMDGVSVSRAHYVFQQVAYDMARFMDDYDIILSPTVATPPPMVGTRAR